jgi:sugar lactone lactonase YvrE
MRGPLATATFAVLVGLAGGCGGASTTTPDAGAPAPQRQLRLVAGALGGIGTMDGVGNDSRFTQNNALAYDGHGTLYVGDENAVRGIDVSSGTVTTLAGTVDVAGSADGPGARALFTSVRGLALDGAGHLFAADGGNSTIRQIDLATGTVSTLAGLAQAPGSADGNLTTARFNQPYALLADKNGHLYVGDYSDSVVRVVDLSAGSVKTLAGVAGQPGTADGAGAAARFTGVIGLQLESQGHLIVVDENVTVRRLDVATGEVSTVYSDTSPDGLALDSPVYDGQGHVLTTGPNTGQLFRIDLATGQRQELNPPSMWKETDAQGPLVTAGFNQPVGLALNEAGELFVGDEITIRTVDLAAQHVSTLAGKVWDADTLDGVGAAARFVGPKGVATDGTYAYVADSSVRKIDLATGAVSTLASQLEAQWLAADGSGHVYVSSGDPSAPGGAIEIVDTATGAMTTQPLPKISGFAITPAGIALDGKGHLFIAEAILQPPGFVDSVVGSGIDELDLQALTIRRIAGGSQGAADGVGSQAQLNAPSGLAFDGAGHLYVADTQNGTIRVLDTQSAAVTTLAGTAGSLGADDGIGSQARFSAPTGLALDGHGRLYVADAGNGSVRSIDLATRAVTTFAGAAGIHGVRPGPLPGRLNTPFGIAVTEKGALVLTDNRENAVLAIE